MNRIGLLILLIGTLLAGKLGISYDQPPNSRISFLEEKHPSEPSACLWFASEAEETTEVEQENDPSSEPGLQSSLPISFFQRLPRFPTVLSFFYVSQWEKVRNLIIRFRNFRI
jgi:hypothetical protein